MKAQEQIRQYLKVEGRKQTWLAAQVNCTPATLSHWLTGNQIPQPYFRAQLAGVTGLPISEKGAWE